MALVSRCTYHIFWGMPSAARVRGVCLARHTSPALTERLGAPVACSVPSTEDVTNLNFFRVAPSQPQKRCGAPAAMCHTQLPLTHLPLTHIHIELLVPDSLSSLTDIALLVRAKLLRSAIYYILSVQCIVLTDWPMRTPRVRTLRHSGAPALSVACLPKHAFTQNASCRPRRRRAPL
jgi:hypothetical protein